MKVRIIKSDTCQDCRAYLKRLDKVKFAYETMDGNSDSMKKELDEWKIDKMPVVQIINDEGKVLYQFAPGTWSPAAISFKIQELLRKK